MSVEDDVRLRLCAQQALLSHVTPDLRSVSLDIDPERRFIFVRFIFNSEPSESVRDAAACAGTEIIAEYSGDWNFDEQYMNCPAPESMSHLRLLVYLRCEDEWVSPRA